MLLTRVGDKAELVQTIILRAINDFVTISTTLKIRPTYARTHTPGNVPLCTIVPLSSQQAHIFNLINSLTIWVIDRMLVRYIIVRTEKLFGPCTVIALTGVLYRIRIVY